jgi:predicted GNAT family acetyltransferase
MLINLFQDPVKFFNHVNEFLIQHEAENSILFSNIEGIISKRYTGNNLMISIQRKGKIVLVAIMTPPHNLVLSYTQVMKSIEHLIRFLINNNIELPGLLAFKKSAQRFVKLWTKKKKISHNLVMNERVYKLERVNERYLGSHAFSPVDLSYESLILKWLKSFIEEALPHENSEIDEELRKLTRQRIKENRYYMLFDNEVPVSMVHRARNTPNGNLINQVFTPYDLRGRGYATEAVARISKVILDDGNRYCFLFTDLSNLTSNKIYQDVGYKPIMDIDQYKFILSE